MFANKILKNKLKLDNKLIIEPKKDLDLSIEELDNLDTPISNMVKHFISKRDIEKEILPPSIEARVTAIEEAITDIILSQMEE